MGGRGWNGVVVMVLLGMVTQAMAFCASGYSCYPDDDGTVWVLKDDGNVNGPTCKNVCETALCGTGTFHSCHRNKPLPTTMEEFAPIAEGLGFECRVGTCWDGLGPADQFRVSKNTATDGTKACYLPAESAPASCDSNPGSANCFGDFFGLVCPCEPRVLEEACYWEDPANQPTIPTFPTDDVGTSCLERVNYWRKRACDEGWPECPPCGLPPMTECVGCHECANSESDHDQANGAHSSFRRCGEPVQGQGGGSNCASVIDSFISEREPSGVCTGHCGPIVRHGCQTFHWGKDHDTNFHTLNWRSCNTDKCDSYCSNPTAEACFRVETSPAPSPGVVSPPIAPSPISVSYTPNGVSSLAVSFLSLLWAAVVSLSLS